MVLLVNLVPALVALLALARALRARPAGPFPVLFVCGLNAALIALSAWATRAFPSPAVSLGLTCLASPLAEELTRSAFSRREPGGAWNARTVSLVLGGVEAALRIVHYARALVDQRVALAPAEALTLLSVAAALLFHAGVGLFWEIRAAAAGRARATCDSIVLHACFNGAVLATAPSAVEGRIPHLAALVAIEALCLAWLAGRRRAPRGLA